MKDSFRRREFIKTISLAGVSAVMAGPLAGEVVSGFARHEIRNKFLLVSFDPKTGTYSAQRTNGGHLLSNGTVNVNLKVGKRALTSGSFSYKVRSGVVADELGSGSRLTISCRDHDKIIELEVHLSLYDELNGLVVDVVCKNISNRDIVIHSIEPCSGVDGTGVTVHAPGVEKCITNGQMYFDDGLIHTFGNREGSVESGDLKGVTLTNGPFAGSAETIHSWWNAGLFNGYDKEGIALGYIKNFSALGNLLISRTAPDRIALIAESVYAPQLSLKPGVAVSSDSFLITVATNPYKALENYADIASKASKLYPRSANWVINGWCSWFYTLAQVSEDEVIRNTEFAARHLKPYGLEYIQIDEGYQKAHGDWEGNERFPHGMKWLAEKIKSYGLKAGLWISPYVISETTEIYRDHKDWLVRKKDGSLQRVGNWPQGAEPPADENPKRYCLDITHPEASRWLHELVERIVRDWGYEMIKIDFVAWSILAAEQYHDWTLSSAQVYRKGMEIMRLAAGNKCHILECGPGSITTGLIDSMRIELDVNYGFADTAWNTYFTDPACSMSAAGNRYYFHNRTWINDVDHLCTHLLNTRQSEAAATIIAMSGGNMMSGDRLIQLDADKLNILKTITPSFGQAAVPIDLFDSDMATAFAMKVSRPFGEWTVAAFFNPNLTEVATKKFPLNRMWLDVEKTYLVYDFWDKQFLGEIERELSITIQPGSVRLLAIHEKTAHPIVISTDRHVMQGAQEIGDLTWNESTNTISATSLGPAGTSHNIYVYVPGNHPWVWGGYVLFRDYNDYTLKLVHNNIIEVHVRFENSDRVTWRIDIDDFFKE